MTGSFFEMHEDDGTFNLCRRELDIDELSVSLPRRSLQYMEMFDQLPDIPLPNGA